MGRYLIAGAAGFIGFRLSRYLLDRGHEVLGIDNLNDYHDVHLKEARLAQLAPYPHLCFRRLDIADRPSLEGLLATEKPERVVNLAAQAGVRYSLTNPHAYVESNLVGNVDHPVSPQAATKKANELMARTYSHLHGLPTTGLRFFTVYGPWGRPGMALFLLTKAILEGRPVEIYNYGQMRRDFALMISSKAWHGCSTGCRMPTRSGTPRRATQAPPPPPTVCTTSATINPSSCWTL